jgi:8-oxo-dGTP diphosphatase
MVRPFSVTGLLIRGKEILAVSRKNDPNDFGLPGGKLDPGETPVQALIRELFEETGITVKSCTVIFEDEDRILWGELRPAVTFLVSSWDGEPYSKEAGVVKWVEPSVITDPSTSFHEYNSKLFGSLIPELRQSLGLD